MAGLTLDPPLVTKFQLISNLRDLGLGRDQTVMLHASVKKIGWIVGGPDTVIEAILEILGQDGTLMMVASWEGNPYELEFWPSEKREVYAAECPPFDPARSRADHRKMGILAEYLRTWPGSRRSRHPFGFVAVGARAEWILADQPLQYRDGKGSPLEKLCEAKGFVLLLGSPLSNVTLLHYAENIANVPNKRIDRYRMPILQNGRRVMMDFEEYDTTRGIVDWPEDYFETIVQCYLATIPRTNGQVGDAKAYLIDATSLVAFGKDWMEQHFV